MYEKITNIVGMGLVYMASMGLLGGDKTSYTPVKEGQKSFSCSRVRDDLDHKCRLCNPGGDKKQEPQEFPNIHPGVIDPAPSYDLEGQLDRVKIGLSRQYSRMFPKNPFDVGTGPYNPHPEEMNAIMKLRGTEVGNGSKVTCWPEHPDTKPFPKPKPRPLPWESWKPKMYSVDMVVCKSSNLPTIVIQQEMFDLKQYQEKMNNSGSQVITQQSPADEYRETRGKEPPGAGPSPEQDRDRSREKDRERDRREHEKKEKNGK